MPTLTIDTRFALLNEAVDYGPWSGGCNGIFLTGRALDTHGAGVSGLRVRIWDEATGAALVIATDSDGAFQVQLADSLIDTTFNIQLLGSGGLTVLSDVVYAQAIPDCGLNAMTVTFVETP